MNGRKLILSVVLPLFVAGANCFAQTSEYQKDAADLATLFRGKQPILYPYRYNGTFYLESREFGQGNVWYNGKVYQDVPLNLNANQMELEVRPSREH